MRSTEEWIGDHDDQAIPNRVRVRVFERARGRCEKCERRIHAGDRWDADHARPLWLGGEHRESNLILKCVPCHSKKTKDEAAQRAKVYRVRDKHLGIKKPRTIRAWRKFDGTRVFAPRGR